MTSDIVAIFTAACPAVNGFLARSDYLLSLPAFAPMTRVHPPVVNRRASAGRNSLAAVATIPCGLTNRLIVNLFRFVSFVGRFHPYVKSCSANGAVGICAGQGDFVDTRKFSKLANELKNQRFQHGRAVDQDLPVRLDLKLVSPSPVRKVPRNPF